MRVLEKSEYHFLPALKIPLSRNIAFIPNVSEERRFFCAHESFAVCSQILVWCKIIHSVWYG